MNPDVKVGDWVTWTKVTTRANSISMIVWQGKVHSFEDGNVWVRRGSRMYLLRPEAIRKRGQTNELTEAFRKVHGL